MFVLSRLRAFTVITWKKPIEDPVREWGQLLAYLPEVKKRLDQRGRQRGGGGVIFLPAPSLTLANLLSPKDTIGLEANRMGVSNQEARQMALDEIRGWLALVGREPAEYDDLL
jgi:hypothetical protein